MRPKEKKTMMTPQKRRDLPNTFEGHFAKRLIKFREKNGMKPEEAADAIGVSRATYFNWESASSSPSIKYLPKIAKTFGISIRCTIPGNDPGK